MSIKAAPWCWYLQCLDKPVGFFILQLLSKCAGCHVDVLFSMLRELLHGLNKSSWFEPNLRPKHLLALKSIPLAYFTVVWLCRQAFLVEENCRTGWNTWLGKVAETKPLRCIGLEESWSRTQPSYVLCPPQFAGT